MNQTVKPELKSPLLPSELMVGNLVLDSTGNTTIVESIIPDHERVRYGIPLTEDRLLELGFTKLILNEWQFALKISAITLCARQNAGCWYFQLSEIYLGDLLKYVHQVQNFCSVFGKELIEAGYMKLREGGENNG